MGAEWSTFMRANQVLGHNKYYVQPNKIQPYWVTSNTTQTKSSPTQTTINTTQIKSYP